MKNEIELTDLAEEMNDFFVAKLIAYGNQRFQEGKDFVLSEGSQDIPTPKEKTI